ncbi:transmembrane protein, putative [Medicago truncatula]|uniref:Transmembrane protein, putative n=1 Tax=Medicago truncatula TaxID=3880 RepID=G7IY72_MEDTR|nr:transmembrane protein, putative [Medicago truncatula]
MAGEKGGGLKAGGLGGRLPSLIMIQFFFLPIIIFFYIKIPKIKGGFVAFVAAPAPIDSAPSNISNEEKLVPLWPLWQRTRTPLHFHLGLLGVL